MDTQLKPQVIDSEAPEGASENLPSVPATAGAVSAKKKGRRELTPEAIRVVRADVLDIVKINLKTAGKVLQGRRKWNNAQVRVFGLLLDKVLPDLKQSHSQIDVTTRNLGELSREELEAIALKGRKVGEQADAEDDQDDDQAIEGDAEVVNGED